MERFTQLIAKHYRISEEQITEEPFPMEHKDSVVVEDEHYPVVQVSVDKNGVMGVFMVCLAFLLNLHTLVITGIVVVATGLMLTVLKLSAENAESCSSPAEAVMFTLFIVLASIHLQGVVAAVLAATCSWFVFFSLDALWKNGEIVNNKEDELH